MQVHNKDVDVQLERCHCLPASLKWKRR